MRLMMGLAAALLLGVPGAASAQQQQVEAEDARDIVVNGRRFQPSKWREAETAHVVVLSDGRESELIEIAHNLERLHFLLSVLLNRTDTVDETVKLRVTLVGDAAEFEAMDLRNLRWQQGPFHAAFSPSRYYDPREDGALLATTRIDQKAVLERGVPLGFALMGQQLPGAGSGPPGGLPLQGQSALFGLQSQPDLIPPVNERAVPLSAEGMIYAGFAQHYLQTYFPAAYPRWYLDGFGQIFSTMQVRRDGALEYGRAPEGTSAVLQRFGSYPLGDVLNERYREQPGSRTRWTPVHAWMLTHFLFFSEARRPQFRQYLSAFANGARPETATAAFGDLDRLATELRAYYRAKKPYERMTYPAERAEAPVVRRLTRGQAAFVKGRLELGSRVAIPPAPPADADPKLAAEMTKARERALAGRERWLRGLRGEAARWPADVEAQLLLAEAECRSGNDAECLVAADRALALAPNSSAALTWKGTALAQQAVAVPPGARAGQLRSARATIGQANRADTEAPLPLLAYHRSFTEAGEPVPELAIDGLTKAAILVPNAPTTRLALGSELARRGDAVGARAALLPVAKGAYDSPEQAAAQDVLAGLGE